MPASYPVYTDTVIAAAVVAANRFVLKAGTYPAAGAAALGVSRSGGAIGDAMPVDAVGSTLVEAGGAISVDSAISVDATGRAVAQTSTNVKVGRALTAAVQAGDVIEVFLIPNA